jgi:hypothetical protein
VSALIIILIVAAAIYAFSGDETNPPAAQQRAGEGAGAVQQEEAEEGETAERPASPAGEVAGDADQEVTTSSPEAMRELPQPRRTDEGYVEVAQPGEGYTHLARRAATQWLAENQTDFAVTAEHRIYIEDYIQNHLGTQGLQIGDSHTITYDMIREAVDSARGLDEMQLQNLSQYTSALE